MLIRQCGWHWAYFHRPKLLGVVWERRLRLHFTDGLCPACNVRFLAGQRAPQDPAFRAAVQQMRRELGLEKGLD